ncbi:FliH/SctL family protein [Cellulomonas fimi]|uniref:Flagellar assembly protein FliH n=1 Tax=Cellulomonas fimi TaxID=1708 RepID=A0A7Y0LZG6_CELFI|nr:FliH/SctL family protein [Cellulomonas fimi]NMR21041.1 flagellar assembly protein FliH [Cellulomonas fimi]
MSEPVAVSAPVVAPVARFRPAPVGGVLDARSDHGVEQARAAGWAAGWAAGTRAASEAAQHQRRTLDDAFRAAERERAADVQAALAALGRAAAAASARVDPVLAESSAALDASAVTLAEAVLGHELADGDARARAALARALSLPAEPAVHTIRLHPADVRALTALGLVDSLPDGVTVVPDASLAPGDAVSELPDGFLDARIGSAVERVRRALAADTPAADVSDRARAQARAGSDTSTWGGAR